MKKIFLLVTLILTTGAMLGQNLKPYQVSNPVEGNILVIKQNIEEALVSKGFEILGGYEVETKGVSYIIILTHPLIIEAIQKTGGLTAMATGMKISLTQNFEEIDIAFTHPEYWGNAYFQNKYPDIQSNIETVFIELEKALRDCCIDSFTPFGSKEGLSEKELRHYHYMFGMEYFEDIVELAEITSFSEATTKIENNLKQQTDSKLIYSKEIPGKDLKIYGIQLRGEKGEGHFLPIIDTEFPKHVSFLPYEILVTDKNVVMLHGRYRIALSFPDLTMTTFSKIMSTPGDIETQMQAIVK